MTPGKRTLYMHVGFSKTASTWLQTCVFPELSNVEYLSRDYISMQLKSSGLADEGCTSLNSPFNLSPAFWGARGADFLLSFLDSKTVNQMNSNILISDENILLGRGFFQNRPNYLHPYSCKDPHVFLEHIRQVKLLLDEIDFDELKILICIRKQDNWLASRYAQSSAFIRNASQADFESQINNLLFNPMHYYRVGTWTDYYHLYRLLEECLGSENILFLPFELLEASSRDFVRRISNFTQSPMQADIGENKKNIRRISSGDKHVWALRGRIITMMPQRIWRHIRIIPSRFELGPFINRRIFLDSGLSNKIMQRVGESNRKLDWELPDDLHDLKYY